MIEILYNRIKWGCSSVWTCLTKHSPEPFYDNYFGWIKSKTLWYIFVFYYAIKNLFRPFPKEIISVDVSSRYK